MGSPQFNIEDVEVRLAQSDEEIKAAQHLRYKVFYEEFSATPTEQMAKERRDFDSFDDVTDHLIAVDTSQKDINDRIIGTYRLLRHDIADKHGKFYTSDEYDIKPLMTCGEPLLELGRSCVLDQYRTRPIMQLLWEAIVDYNYRHNIGLMFGCASLTGTDISALSTQLSYLHHFHIAPSKFCPVALSERYVDMNIFPKEDINEKQAFKSLPPLIKGYIRAGAYVGEGAVIDHQFNTTDICIVLPVHQIASRYKNHYTRKINQASANTAEDQTTAQKTDGVLAESSA